MKLGLITFTESGAIRYHGDGNSRRLPLQSAEYGVSREVWELRATGHRLSAPKARERLSPGRPSAILISINSSDFFPT